MPRAAAKPAPTSPPVLVIAGEELFLRNDHLAAIIRSTFGDEDPGMGFIRLDPVSLGADAITTILDELRTPSMFAPKKLVVVEPADVLFKKAEAEDEDRISNRELLENYVAAPVDFATLVLVADSWLKTTRLHKAIDKMGGVRWAESMKSHLVPGWITRHAKERYNKTIDPAATSRLAELIGPDLQRLDNELAKLALYQPEAPGISAEAVNALVGFQHEQEIWDMINALAQRDAPTALRKIDEIWGLGTKIEYTVAGAVFSWLNQVIKARELIDRRMPDALIGKELRIWPPDRAQQVIALARTWGLQGAARWSGEMLQMDLANKSSLGEPRRNLEKFVVQLCMT